MKLWIDAQLSPALAQWITDHFEGIEAIAVRELGLRDAEDAEIFEAARQARVIVMSKDSDSHLSCGGGREGVAGVTEAQEGILALACGQRQTVLRRQGSRNRAVVFSEECGVLPMVTAEWLAQTLYAAVLSRRGWSRWLACISRSLHSLRRSVLGFRFF